ncbi:MAG: N-acetylmuramoyl-L-alanine amidase [FCB group bacterium]|jgi:N-acetylmuramoyl-L-alanine amidase|nr:N-acetylmuramoyl-L-alanine amidase [FCB group bacterium]
MKPVLTYRRFAMAVSLCTLAGAYAFGATETFRLGEGAAAKQAVLESATRNGITYVPLGSLIRQVGGQAQVTPQKITVDFGGYAALIQVNDAVVSGSLAQFTLPHPVIEGGGEAWIAVDDVTAFLRQAFAANATRSTAPAAAPQEDELLEQVTAETPPDSEGVPVPSSTPATQVASRVVILDAGHGGTDTGARGDSLEEKNLTLDLAQRVAKVLETGPGGIKPVLTRKDDTAIALLDRVNAAIQQGGLFVSLHAGAAQSAGIGGVEIFYSSDDAMGEAASGGMASGMKTAERYRYAKASRDLAEAVAKALTAREGIRLAGAHAVRIPLLHHVPMPGVLIEAGALTNAEDAAALASPEHLDLLASAVAEGIQRYLGVTAATAPVEASTP